MEAFILSTKTERCSKRILSGPISWAWICRIRPSFVIFAAIRQAALPLPMYKTLGQVWGTSSAPSLPCKTAQKELAGAGYYCFKIDPTGQSFLYQLFNSLSLGKNVFFIDGNRRIIFSPDPSQMGKDVSKEADIQQLFQGQSTSIRFRQGTVDKVISYTLFNPAKDGRLQWVLISEQSWAEIMQPSLPYRQFLLILLALGVIVPVLVTTYGVRHITDPIQELIRVARAGHREPVQDPD